jgi:hypothetical protein
MSKPRAAVRPDLVGATPLFYPIVEQKTFGNLDALCRHVGVPRTVLDVYIERAEIERSDVVICDQVRLGDRDNNVCMALLRLPGGSVRLCAAFLGELGPDPDAASAFAVELLAELGRPNGFATVVEFRPSPKRAAQ